MQNFQDEFGRRMSRASDLIRKIVNRPDGAKPHPLSARRADEASARQLEDEKEGFSTISMALRAASRKHEHSSRPFLPLAPASPQPLTL